MILTLLLRYRYLWAILWLGLVALSFASDSRLELERSIDQLFQGRDPDLATYRALSQHFGAREPVLIAYAEPQGFDEDSQALARLERLEAFLDQQDGIAETISLADLNALSLEALQAPITDENYFSRRLLDLLEGFTHSADRRTLALLCLVDRDANRGAILTAIRTWLDDHAEEYPQAALVGEPVMVSEGMDLLERDGQRLAWHASWLMAGVLLLSFGSLRWMLIAGAVVQSSLAVTRLLVALLGLQLTLVSSMFSSVVTVIAVAAIMHWIVRYRECRQREEPPHQALRDSLGQLIAPMTWACLTDAAGFAALLVADIGPVRDFGLMMILGSLMVLVALLALVPTLVLVPLPAGLRWLDRVAQWNWQQRLMDRPLEWPLILTRHAPRRWLTLVAAASLIATVGLSWSRVETDFTRNFRDSSRIIEEYRFVESRLGGAGVWDILVPLEGELDWQQLQAVRELEDRLRNEVQVRTPQGVEPGLTKVLSVADAILAVLPFDLSRLPVVNDLVVRRGMAELERRMPSWVDTMVTRDGDAQGRHYLRILLRSNQQQPAEQRQQIIEQVQAICRDAADDFPPPGPRVTGWFVLLTKLVETLMGDQLKTFTVASVAVLLMMWLATQRLSLALIALVPNLMPIGVVLGLLGWLEIPINMGVALIAAVSIGLSIDNTLHYLAVFRQGEQRHHDPTQAIHEAQHRAGLASCFATLALMAGFASLMTSEFVPTVYFGGLVCASMLGGLLGNLVVLPLLLQLLVGSDDSRMRAAPTSAEPTDDRATPPQS